MAAGSSSFRNTTEEVYGVLRQRAVMFRFLPEQPIVESELARELNVSRTPLRAALTRLAGEGYIERDARRGFRCRKLNPKQIVELFEMRVELEAFSVARACERAQEADILSLIQFCRREGRERFGKSEELQLDFDEEFHTRLTLLSGNRELAESLATLNGRVRFVRWVDMPGRLETTDREHLDILEAILARDARAADQRIRQHIGRRKEQIHAAIKEGITRILVSTSQEQGSADAGALLVGTTNPT